MGIDRTSLAALLYARALMGNKLGRTLVLGRQKVNVESSEFVDLLEYCLPQRVWSDKTVVGLGSYADQMLAALGANPIDSLDASGYEGATIVQDLNRPAPAELKRSYDVVFDGGTIEHVFMAGLALLETASMVAPGGCFISVATGNNFLGHGFWQLSPEVYFRSLTPGRGFKDVRVFLVPVGWRDRWIEIPDPDKVHQRVIFVNARETYIVCIARRQDAGDMSDDEPLPQQSDYLASWKSGTGEYAGRSLVERFAGGSVLYQLRSILSPAMRSSARRWMIALPGLDKLTKRRRWTVLVADASRAHHGRRT